MANKPRSGVDYLSRYVRLPDYEKLIRSNCGVERMYAFIRLIDRIGDTGGYYTSWDEDIAELFAVDERYRKEDLDIVVNSALKRNFFDKDIYEKHSVLTSKYLQELYLMMTPNRSYVVFKEDYLLINFRNVSEKRIGKIKIENSEGILLDIALFPELCPENKSDKTDPDNTVNKDSLNENSYFLNENGHFLNGIPQRKEKEIKEKEIKLKEITSCEKGKEIAVTASAAGDMTAKSTEVLSPPSPKKREKEIFSASQPETKLRLGEYNNVILTENELERLKNEFPHEWENLIEHLSEYMECHGKKYSSHFATIRKWGKRDAENKSNSYASKKDRREHLSDNDDSFDVDEFFLRSLECSQRKMREMMAKAPSSQ